MFCTKCGTQVPEGTKFCPSCGAQMEQQPTQQPEPTQQYQQPVEPQYQQPQQPVPEDPWDAPQPVEQQYNQQYQPMYNQPPMGQPMAYAPPMNWHKFLIYFSLWAGAVLNLIGGILALTGAHYNMAGGSGSAGLVYAFFPSLHVCDILYGILMIATAAFMIYTRFQLAGFKRSGPKCILAVYAINIGVSLLYIIATSAILGENMADVSTISSVVTAIIMIVVNNIYYKKRAFMFVN